jgi:hypothetical protein
MIRGMANGQRACALLPLLICLVVAARGQSLTSAQLKSEAFLFTPTGFEQEGEPRWATGAHVGQLQIVVRDAATGRVTPCRMNVVGPDGNFYQPPPNRLSLYALTGSWPKPGSKGNRIGKAPYRYVGRFFYTTGESTVSVLPGLVRVEIWKGLEYRPESVTIRVIQGETARVEVSLSRTASMASSGYHVGDSHLHLPRLTDEDDAIALDLLEAEDCRYGFILTYNEPAGPYAAVMATLDYPQRAIGRGTIRRRGDYQIVSGQEYRSTTYGHLNLYYLDDLIFSGKSNDANHWPVYGEVGRETAARGGFAIMAHGGYGQEIWADAALGTIHAVELLQFGIYRGIELEGWYNMLNTGYRFPAQASCDYPPCRTLADCRTYVHHTAAPQMDEWLAGVAAGRSFFTTGPLVLLEVDGEKPGAQIRRSGQGPHAVKARVRVRCEVTAVTDIDLIVNGRVVEHRTLTRAEGQGRWIEMERASRSLNPPGLQRARTRKRQLICPTPRRTPIQFLSISTTAPRISARHSMHGSRASTNRLRPTPNASFRSEPGWWLTFSRRAISCSGSGQMAGSRPIWCHPRSPSRPTPPERACAISVPMVASRIQPTRS